MRGALLAAEGLVLLLATYFFWHISSFPATRDETGIVMTEWNWALIILGGGIGLYSVLHHPAWVQLRRSTRLALLATGFFIYGLILMTSPILRDATFGVDRADWFWLLLLVIPFYVIRLITQRRLWTFVWLEVWFAALLGLCMVAVLVTPEVTGYPSRGFGMLMRPILGILWVLFLVELARHQGRMDAVLHLMIALGLLIGYVALSASQWDLTKSGAFRGLINRLDALPDLAPFATLNPNELAGVMIWLIPLLFGTAFYPFKRLRLMWVGLSAVALILLMTALIIGQSRSAIFGLIITAVFGALVFMPRRFRWGALGAFILLLGLQFLLLFNLWPGDDEGDAGILSLRDQITASERFMYWDVAFDMIGDYPLTGVGMNMYRDIGRVRVDYPLDPDAVNQYPPHAHNEFIQITTDFGLPGLVVFVAWYALAGWMLWMVIQRGSRPARMIAVAAGAGLLAHAIYGMTDAIPIWDRFAFVFWLTLGVLVAQFKLEKTNWHNAINKRTIDLS